MRIEHVAIWVKDLEKVKNFYVRYFNGQSNAKYINPVKQFESYFITFASGARLELMYKPTVEVSQSTALHTGWAHIAFAVGSREKVDQLTQQLRQDGFTILGEPRITGDGYYESVVADPEGNLVEITV